MACIEWVLLMSKSSSLLRSSTSSSSSSSSSSSLTSLSSLSSKCLPYWHWHNFTNVVITTRNLLAMHIARFDIFYNPDITLAVMV